MPIVWRPALRVSSLSSAAIDSSRLVRRVNIPYDNATAPSGLIQAKTVDPWSKSGKYALGWVYFSTALLLVAILIRTYHFWTDRIRTALHQDHCSHRTRRYESLSTTLSSQGQTPIDTPQTDTDRSTTYLLSPGDLSEKLSSPTQSSISSIAPLNILVASFRFLFYRPLPLIQLRKRWRPILMPSLPALAISLAALAFTTSYCFLPQHLYWESIRFGSPPIAIRSGMLAVALMPWLVALSAKANLITLLTGIGHERLNVLHRWGGWLCLFLSLLHTIPFYITPIWDQGGYRAFRSYFGTGIYIYGTGIAALAPLCFLCLHSLPFIRNWMYELFVLLHVPVAIIFLAMMFWHCSNYLTSWNYLYATVGIWGVCYSFRVCFLNWLNPSRKSWLHGDQASVRLLSENAMKVIIPTRTRWKPGQYVYLRMPGISVFENHPFTIASLCHEDFPSDFGDEYRDMSLVFRPYGGFTKKVLDRAQKQGPWHCYRALLDGPYGGMTRTLTAFDTVVLLAGGSGITALVSHLLDLVKRMRDGKAVTRRIHVVWALKRPEIMDWFKEELRICRECAPPDSITFQFYVTTAKRQATTGHLLSASTPHRALGEIFENKVKGNFQDIAQNRASTFSEVSTGNFSTMIDDEAAGDPEKEGELRREVQDHISGLPEAHILLPRTGPNFSLVQPQLALPIQQKRHRMALSLDIAAATRVPAGTVQTVNIAPARTKEPPRVPLLQTAQPVASLKCNVDTNPGFDFGFPTTPTEFQKNLMRFAFLPAAVRKRGGWSTEYGRPDIPYMLQQFSKDFGQRTCIFVCGPPSMRIDASRAVAQLQTKVMTYPTIQEIYLHTENYAI